MKTTDTDAVTTLSTEKVAKKGMRKFLQNLQPSSGGKENLVGAGRTVPDTPVDGKVVKPEPTFNQMEIKVKDKKEKLPVAQVFPSLYKKLVIEDLTSTAGPSEQYWEVMAERRRKALEEVIEENRQLREIVSALEEENNSCKTLLESTTDLVNALKEVLNESQCMDYNNAQESADTNEDSGLSTPDSSSDKHIHKKMKTSHSTFSSGSFPMNIDESDSDAYSDID